MSISKREFGTQAKPSVRKRVRPESSYRDDEQREDKKTRTAKASSAPAYFRVADPSSPKRIPQQESHLRADYRRHHRAHIGGRLDDRSRFAEVSDIEQTSRSR